MDQSQDRRVAALAAAVYVPLTLAAAALFALAAAARGQAPTVVAAGAFWVGLLTLIVLMPLVIPAARARLERR